MDYVLVKALVSSSWAFEYVANGIIFDQKIVVLCDNPLALLQSSLHWAWATRYGSSIRNAGYNYTPTDCFETFPFPTSVEPLADVSSRYQRYRKQIMCERQQGLTKTYNLFHDPKEQSEDIVRLRALQIEMDHAVAAAYGWDDLDLSHGFQQTKQSVCYTLSELARSTVLDRLLVLNHERYREEVKAGLHEKQSKSDGVKHGSAKKKRQDIDAQGGLY